MKRALVVAFVVVLLALNASSEFISLVAANFTPLPELPTPIYIRADGNVEPFTAPIQRTGNVYTLTGDINNTVEVQLSDMVLDGDGFVITKPSIDTGGLMMPIGWLPGVDVNGVSNVTIRNLVFEGCITGVRVENASGVIVRENIIRDTLSGIAVFSSSEVNITGNDIALSSESFATGINFLPTDPSSYDPHHIVIEGNRIAGNSSEVPTQPPQPEQYGIWGGFSYSTLSANVFRAIKGIGLYYTGSNNLIVGNSFQGSYEGVFFTGSAELSVNSIFYGNNFEGNSKNVVVPYIRNPPANFWDNGTIGNFWSDYSGVDVNGDGVGDSPYILETVYFDYDLNHDVTVQEGVDHFPLMAPLDLSGSSPEPTIPEFTSWMITPLFMLVALTVIAFHFKKRK